MNFSEHFYFVKINYLLILFYFQHALTTTHPGAMVSRIFIWLAADEPWPDMTTLFPNVERREIVEDRVCKFIL